jgi:hypothetical protein
MKSRADTPHFADAKFTRRRFMCALVALAPAASLAAASPNKPRNAIDVKELGAFGNGKLPDLRQIREAIRRAAEGPGGATVYFPPGEYFLGAADDAVLLSAEALRDVRLVGDRATLSCRSVAGTSTMLELSGCRNVAVEGLTFRDYGLKRDINWLGAAAIRIANAGAVGCQNIQITNCAFDSVLSAVVCRRSDENPRLRSRDITLTNLRVSRSYYGFSFQDNGDNVVGRGLFCDDVKRSYFPYGITNHDIELETINNATGYTDVLIKCYHGDTSRIRAKVKCRGKRSGDAIVALDQQHEKGRGAIRQIDLQLDIDDVDCRLETAVLIRSLDQRGTPERQTQSRWDDIAIEGEIRICEKTKLLEIYTVGKVPGSLRIGRTLAKNPRLPRSFPGFNVTGV